MRSSRAASRGSTVLRGKPAGMWLTLHMSQQTCTYVRVHDSYRLISIMITSCGVNQANSNSRGYADADNTEFRLSNTLPFPYA